MHILKALVPALALIVGTGAHPLEARASKGWDGPGFYQIINAYTGTAVDLYNGQSKLGTPIYGWAAAKPEERNDHQIWLIARVKNGEYSILNHGESVAIGATGSNKPVVSKGINVDDAEIRWKLSILAKGAVSFQSVKYPGNNLDLSGSSKKNGTPILAYPQTKNKNQQWILVPVDVGGGEGGDDLFPPLSMEEL